MGALLANFPLHWLLYFNLAEGEVISGVDIAPIERFLSPFVMAFAFVVTGAELAPSKHFEIAVALSFVWLIGGIAAILFAMNSGVDITVGIGTLGPLVGVIFGCLFEWHKNKRGEDKSDKSVA